MGQRSQIIFKVEKVYWNENNPNNKPSQIYVYHNQWLYGAMFLRYGSKLIESLNFLIDEHKNSGWKSKYPIDFKELIDKAVKHCNSYDLKAMTRTDEYLNNGNYNKELIDSDDSVDFLKKWDNNNGYLYIELSNDGVVCYDIVNGYEDAAELESRSPTDYFLLFHKLEELEDKDDFTKSVKKAIDYLLKVPQVSCFDKLDDFRKSLKEEED